MAKPTIVFLVPLCNAVNGQLQEVRWTCSQGAIQALGDLCFMEGRGPLQAHASGLKTWEWASSSSWKLSGPFIDFHSFKCDTTCRGLGCGVCIPQKKERGFLLWFGHFAHFEIAQWKPQFLTASMPKPQLSTTVSPCHYPAVNIH
jgi:hypothetical protein